MIPLMCLTRKEIVWNFTPECRKSFETLKKAFSTALVLTHWVPNVQIILETDASNYTLATILYHISRWFWSLPDHFSLLDLYCPRAQLQHTWQGVTCNLWSLQNLETLPRRSSFSDQCRHQPQKPQIFCNHQTPHSTTSPLVQIFVTIQPHHPFPPGPANLDPNPTLWLDDGMSTLRREAATMPP